MEDPLISIIIPVYNAVKTIENTLNSVLNQTYSKIQLIVIDGFSNDGTIDVVQLFSDRIDVLISEKDRGIYNAMNKGVDLAEGDFYYFLGADDILSSRDVIHELFSHKINDSVKLVFGNVLNIGFVNSKIPMVHQSEFSSKLIWKNTLHHQGAFYHSSVFDVFRYDEALNVLADYELNISLYNQKVEALQNTVIVAHCLAQGVSKKFNKKLYKEELCLKKRQLSAFLYLMQIPWVWSKFLYKQF